MTIASCITCATEFQRMKGWQKCCSTSCRAIRQKQLISEKNKRARKVRMSKLHPCTKCGTVFAGSDSYCKICYNQYRRAEYRKNIEKIKERKKKYNGNPPALKLARESMRRARMRDPAGSKEKLQRWRVANKDRVSVHDFNKRAKRRNATKGQRVTIEDWRQLLLLWGHRCAYCGERKSLTRDHMIPLIRGGVHDVSNIAPACRSCNSRKCHRTVDEYFDWLDEVRAA